MKKYKIPVNVHEIVVPDEVLPMGVAQELEKNQYKDWIIVEKLIPLEGIND